MERRRRRSVVRAVGAGVLALLGGCLGDATSGTGPRRPPDAPADQPRRTPDRPDLYVASFDFDGTEEGDLRVFGEVGNRGGVERTATVRVRVQLGGETLTRETETAVEPDATTEFSVTFDVTEEEFLDGGDLDVDVV